MNKYKFLSKLYLSFSIIISISIAIIFTGQFIQDYSSYKKPKFAPPTPQELAMVNQNNEFDPDAYLAGKEQKKSKFAPPTAQELAQLNNDAEFDPDEYLAKKETENNEKAIKPSEIDDWVDVPTQQPSKFPIESLFAMLGSFIIPGIFFYLLKKWFSWLTT